MFLHFGNEASDVVCLRDVGRDADCATFDFGESVQAGDCLVDALFAAGFAGADEDGFSAGEEEGGCCVEA